MSYTTLWEAPDGLWEKIERILPPEKPLDSRGRPALPNRQVVNGILFVLRSGCQWKGLKKEWFGASSSLHARFQSWSEAGVWKKVYRVMKYYHKKGPIQWRWQAVDSKLVSAPLGGDFTGPNPTDRAKLGSKRHLWVDQRGAPLAIQITPANTNRQGSLDLVFVKPPNPACTRRVGRAAFSGGLCGLKLVPAKWRCLVPPTAANAHR